MVTVAVGTDTFGRVKTVRGTPIVTKFATLQFLPVYPLQSFYYISSGPTESIGVPFIGSVQSAGIQGIQLANIDRTSVLIAYIRSVCATAVLLGFLGVLFPGIMYMTGEHLDDFALILLRYLSAVLIVGIVGGTATYLIPLTTRREHEIRSHCYELLGISIDPARLPINTAKAVLEFANQNHNSLDPRKLRLIRDLIDTRVKLAAGTGDLSDESTTDDILWQLQWHFGNGQTHHET